MADDVTITIPGNLADKIIGTDFLDKTYLRETVANLIIEARRDTLPGAEASPATPANDHDDHDPITGVRISDQLACGNCTTGFTNPICPYHGIGATAFDGTDPRSGRGAGRRL